MRKALILPLLLLLAPAAQAQEDACSEAEPCIWAVEISEDGLSAPAGDLEGTVGDWYFFEFTNVDPDEDHTVTYSYDDSSWQVDYLSQRTSDPFELVEEGSHPLVDDVTGDTLDVEVTFEDVANGDGAGGDGTGGDRDDEGDDVSQPFAPVAWLLLGLAGVALLARRR